MSLTVPWPSPCRRLILHGMSSEPPQWKSEVLWSASGVASGILALFCAIATVINAQNLSSQSVVSTVDPHSLGAAITAATGLLVFGLISATCTVVHAVVNRRPIASTSEVQSVA